MKSKWNTYTCNQNCKRTRTFYVKSFTCMDWFPRSFIPLKPFCVMRMFSNLMSEIMLVVRDYILTMLYQYPYSITSYLLYRVIATHPELNVKISVVKQFTYHYLSELSICMYALVLKRKRSIHLKHCPQNGDVRNHKKKNTHSCFIWFHTSVAVSINISRYTPG